VAKTCFHSLHAPKMIMSRNELKEIRETRMMSKAELARKAKVSPITISRIENGMPCRLETQRKILLALGFELSEKHKLFSE
jgi:DNA-binding XRE family transcriptional regulator